MVVVLLALVTLAAASLSSDLVHPSPTLIRHIMWNGFLFGIPLLLGGFLLAGARWALMAGVMYGTVGLALDISTIVQDLIQPDMQRTILMSGITGLLNFLLIVIGGRGFLDVSSAGSPRAGRPPNPPSRSAG